MSSRGLADLGGRGISTALAVVRDAVRRCKASQVRTNRGTPASAASATAVCRGAVSVSAKSGAAVRRAAILGVTISALLKKASRCQRPLAAVSRVANSDRSNGSRLGGGREIACSLAFSGGRPKLADCGALAVGRCPRGKGEGPETSGYGLRVGLRSRQIRRRRAATFVPNRGGGLTMLTGGRANDSAKGPHCIALFRVALPCAATSLARGPSAIQNPAPGCPVGPPAKSGLTTALATACSAVATDSNCVMKPSSP